MARAEHICSVTGCTREIANKKRGLCGPCASSWYYWKRRQRDTKGKALTQRRETLAFWNGRLDWMFQPSFQKTGPMANPNKQDEGNE